MTVPETDRRGSGAVVALTAILTTLLLVWAVGTVLLVRFAPSLGPPAAASTPTAGPEDESAAGPGDSGDVVGGFAGDLRTLLVSKPAGARGVAVFGSPDGKVDIGLAAQNYEDPAEAREWLDGLGYKAGAAVSWNLDGYEVYVGLYQLRDDRAASQWGIDTQRGFASNRFVRQTAYFETVQRGRWFDIGPASPDAAYVAAVFYHGDIGVSVFYTGEVPDVAGMTATAEEQYRRLP